MDGDSKGHQVKDFDATDITTSSPRIWTTIAYGDLVSPMMEILPKGR